MLTTLDKVGLETWATEVTSKRQFLKAEIRKLKKWSWKKTLEH